MSDDEILTLALLDVAGSMIRSLADAIGDYDKLCPTSEAKIIISQAVSLANQVDIRLFERRFAERKALILEASREARAL